MTTSTRERALEGGRDHRNPRPASIGTGGRLRSEFPADFVGMRRQASKLSADDVLSISLSRLKIGDNLPQLAILVLELLEPPHLRRQQAIVLPLPVEVGRLADPGLRAGIRHRHAVCSLLQNKRLLGVRKSRGLYRSPLLPARELSADNSSQKRAGFRGSEQRFRTKFFQS